MKYKVIKKLWRRANKKQEALEIETALLGDRGLMCCLGHCSLQVGYKKKQIDGVPMPSSIDIYKITEEQQDFLDLCFTKIEDTVGIAYCDFEEMAAGINDDPNIFDSVRIKQLKALFKRHGQEIEFV